MEPRDALCSLPGCGHGVRGRDHWCLRLPAKTCRARGSGCSGQLLSSLVGRSGWTLRPLPRWSALSGASAIPRPDPCHAQGRGRGISDPGCTSCISEQADSAFPGVGGSGGSVSIRDLRLPGLLCGSSGRFGKQGLVTPQPGQHRDCGAPGFQGHSGIMRHH